MPITQLLTGDNFIPEQHQQLRERAFKTTICKLGLVDRNNPICEIVARKVIEIDRAGFSATVPLPREP